MHSHALVRAFFFIWSRHYCINPLVGRTKLDWSTVSTCQQFSNHTKHTSSCNPCVSVNYTYSTLFWEPNSLSYGPISRRRQVNPIASRILIGLQNSPTDWWSLTSDLITFMPKHSPSGHRITTCSRQKNPNRYPMNERRIFLKSQLFGRVHDLFRCLSDDTSSLKKV